LVLSNASDGKIDPSRNDSPTKIPKNETGIPIIFETGDRVAPEQVKILLISHMPVLALRPCGK
jgi:hypothetical protein